MDKEITSVLNGIDGIMTIIRPSDGINVRVDIIGPDYVPTCIITDCWADLYDLALLCIHWDNWSIIKISPI